MKYIHREETEDLFHASKVRNVQFSVGMTYVWLATLPAPYLRNATQSGFLVREKKRSSRGELFHIMN